MRLVRAVAAWLTVGIGLCALSLACGPSAAPPTPTPGVDAFAVVRATSQAAFALGRAALDRGDYLQACVLLDTARTNDPDNRAEIRQALDTALERCLTPPLEPTATAAVAVQRTIVVATVPPAAAPTSGPPTPNVKPTSAPPGATPGRPTAATSGGPPLVAWNDPQGRFSIAAPTDWVKAERPQTLFGSGVVQFHDSSGRAEVDVAVDSSARALSPELYAASMELAMQQQVPGYASEQVQPGSTAGNPSIRRVFTFTQRDANGQDHQARGFQVTVVKGSTPYIVSGSAPAEQYQQYSATFDRIVESFRFS